MRNKCERGGREKLPHDVTRVDFFLGQLGFLGPPLREGRFDYFETHLCIYICAIFNTFNILISFLIGHRYRMCSDSLYSTFIIGQAGAILLKNLA